MRSSHLRHCLRQGSTPRPSPDNLAFAAHDRCIGSADACNRAVAGCPIRASRVLRFARLADCGVIGSSVRIWRNRCRSARTAEPVRHAGRIALYNMCQHGSEDGCTVPISRRRRAAISPISGRLTRSFRNDGFTGVEAERRHVHRERDLAELWPQSVPRADLITAVTIGRYKAGLRRIEMTSTIRRRPGRSSNTCAHRGGAETNVRSRRSVGNIRPFGCSVRRRFAAARGSRCFSGRGFLR